MPELPEVETMRRGIEPHIKNQRIKQINIYAPKLRWPIPKTIKQLEKQMITAVNRRGKYIILETKIGSVLIHLGMSGYLQIIKDDTPLKKHDHFEIVFNNGVYLRLNDTRRFGAVLWANDPLKHKLLRALGPEPLTTKFNAKYLYEKSRCINRAIKLFIMDSQIVVGVGNIYANEALFMAKINPNRKSNTLTEMDCKNLATAIKKVLRKAIKAGGTTLKDFQNTEGKPGYFKQKLKVYGRIDGNCTECGEPLSSSRLGQRITIWCHGCQN